MVDNDPSAHHFGTTVSDLDTAVDFYTDVFGFDVAGRFEIGGENFATGVDVEGATGSFAHLDGDGAIVELVEYDPAGEDRTGLDVNDTGAKHLGVSVDDADAFYADLPDDVETLSEPQTTASGATIFFVRDPDDNLVEVIEP